MTQIAATAVVDKKAELGADVYVGPGCIIEAGVVIGNGCELKANVFVGQGTRMGVNNRVFANCVLGEEPQVLSCREPNTVLIIGDDNVFRETVTISRGWPGGGGKTTIGNGNFFMIGTHFGHDCQVEDNIVTGNYTQISGHCKVERNAWLSAFSAAQQFVTIGRFAYTAGYSAVFQDLPPFVRAAGSHPCKVRGLNITGLRRAGFEQHRIRALDRVYRSLYRHGGTHTLAAMVEQQLQQPGLEDDVRYFLEFLQRRARHRMGRYRELFRSQ